MQFSTIAIFAYVNLLRVMDHKIKIPTFGHKHNLLSKNQSKVRTVGYGGGRVSVPSFISSSIKSAYHQIRKKLSLDAHLEITFLSAGLTVSKMLVSRVRISSKDSHGKWTKTEGVWEHVIFNLNIKIRLTNSFQCTQWHDHRQMIRF